MNEKPMTGKDVIKRTIPVAIALLLIAVIAIIVMSVKNCGNKTPQLKNSDEIYIEMGDLKVSKERLYTYMKQQYGMSELLRLVDNQLYAKDMEAVKQEDLDKYIIENVFTSKSLNADEDKQAIKDANKEDFEKIIDSLLMNNLLKKEDVNDDPYATDSKVWEVLRKYYKLQYARREWAKTAYVDKLKKDAKDDGDKHTYSDIFKDEDMETYFKDNYSGTVYGFFIPFTSEAAALKAMNRAGINTNSSVLSEKGWVKSSYDYNSAKLTDDDYLTPAEVYKAFINMYNEVYKGQGREIDPTVYAEKISYTKTLSKVISAITLASDVNKKDVKGDFILPLEVEVAGYEKATIEWSFAEETTCLTIGEDGKVTYTSPESDTTVTLNAKITFTENNTKTVSYELKVKKTEEKESEVVWTVAPVEPFMEFDVDVLKEQDVDYVWTTAKLKEINSTLSTYMKQDSTYLKIEDSADDFYKSYTIKPISCGNYYFLMIKFKQTVGDNLSDVKAEIEEKKVEELFSSNDNNINRMIYQRRHDAGLKIYDCYIEAVYDYQYTYFFETTLKLTDYDKYEDSKKKEESVVARFTVDGKEQTITADTLYEELSDKYGVSISVDLISQYRLISNEKFNTIYNPYTGEVMDKDSYRELLKTEIGNFRKNFEIGYFTYSYLSYYGFIPNFPASYGWSNFKKDYFGAFSDEELLTNSNFGGSVYSEALKAYKETFYSDAKAGEEANWENTDVYKAMKKAYDEWYGLNVVNLIVGIDTNYDGTMDQQSNKDKDANTFVTTTWTDGQKELAKELIELVKVLLPQAAKSSVYDKLEEIRTVYNEADLVDDGPATADSTIYNHNYFAKFKRAGLVLKLENAADYNNSSSLVEEFLDELEKMYKEVKANGEEGVFDVAYASDPVETMYGFHLIYALNIGDNTELPTFDEIITYNLVQQASKYANSAVDYKIKLYDEAVKALKEKGIEYTSDYKMDEAVTKRITAWYTPAVSEVAGDKVLSKDLIDYLEANKANIKANNQAEFNRLLDIIIEVSKKDLED